MKEIIIWLKENWGGILVWVGLIVGGLWLFLDFDFLDFSQYISLGTWITLIITAWIVWRYTVAAQEANKIQTRPLLNLYLEGYGDDLHLQNDGKGPAYNITVKDVKVGGGYTNKFELPTPNILLIPGESTSLRTYAKTPANGIETVSTTAFLGRLSPETIANREVTEKAKKGVILDVSYVGIDREQHSTRFRIYDTAPPARSFCIEFLDYS